jgi:hypothetical protein
MERGDIEMTDPQTVVANPAPLTGSERMRRHRQRRRDGMRCLTIELRETEIEMLVRQGLLPTEMRNDPQAVSRALYRFLDCTLGTMW